MANIGFCYTLVFFTLTITVTGFQYKCHRDICDSGWQFCNDGEERCNVCTLEQCQPDVAKHIFNQCEEKCKVLQKTTTLKPITKVTTNNPVPRLTTEDFPWLFVLLLVMAIVLVALPIITFYHMNKKLNKILSQKVDVERGTSSSTISHIVETVGEVEKRPLLESVLPYHSDSNRHENKMGDISTLAQATSGADQASAPPSYSTDDKMREGSPVEQASSDVDNTLSEKLGNVDLLQSNIQSTTTEDITRLKSL